MTKALRNNVCDFLLSFRILSFSAPGILRFESVSPLSVTLCLPPVSCSLPRFNRRHGIAFYPPGVMNTRCSNTPSNPTEVACAL